MKENSGAFSEHNSSFVILERHKSFLHGIADSTQVIVNTVTIMIQNNINQTRSV